MNNSSDAILPTITNGECQDIEFKSKAHVIGETICSFANTNDGTILVGVLDNGNIVGSSKKDEQVIANIAHTCKPSIYPLINSVEACGKNIFVVKVKKSNQIHSFKNIAYMRVGTHDKPLSAEELIEFAREKKTFEFDSQVCEGASLGDIDEEKVKRFLEKARFERKLDITPNISTREALERVSLIKNNKLTNAAILLFGKASQKFFLQTKLRCARYKGTTPITFIDLRIIKGNIIDQVEEAENFVLSHIKKAAKIVGFERQEVWEYPINALREAIVNAICHRDYAYSSDITMGIFDDKIEISNPGTLPEPLTPEDLKRKHKSIPRNPFVANAFFLIGNIEQWGEGTNKIVKWCLEHGLREPDFEEIAGGFLVRFYAPEDILSLIPEPGKINLEKLGLNERQIRALGLMINEQEKFTIKRYTEAFKISKKTAIRDFKELIKTGFVVKVGVKKGVYYMAQEHVPKK